MIEKIGDPCKLIDCPSGFFIYEGSIGLKTIYHNPYRGSAYEYYDENGIELGDDGSPIKCGTDTDELIVQPIKITLPSEYTKHVGYYLHSDEEAFKEIYCDIGKILPKTTDKKKAIFFGEQMAKKEKLIKWWIIKVVIETETITTIIHKHER